LVSNISGPSRQGHDQRDQNRNDLGVQQSREIKPRPIGDKCNPLCPFFKCGQKALRFSTDHYRGRPIKVAMCAWIGDKCIGASCRYAYCEKKAMLPDGRCAFAVENQPKKMKSFEEELSEVDDIDLPDGFKSLPKKKI